ncbi:MAG: M3 family metallopeptidase, partial [Stackebrandtia sp.]
MTETPNPFLAASRLPYEMPPFDAIEDCHYLPAFERGMSEHRDEVEAIAADPSPPTFDNTVVALERSGRVLSRVALVFFNKTAADTNPTVQ